MPLLAIVRFWSSSRISDFLIFLQSSCIAPSRNDDDDDDDDNDDNDDWSTNIFLERITDVFESNHNICTPPYSVWQTIAPIAYIIEVDLTFVYSMLIPHGRSVCYSSRIHSVQSTKRPERSSIPSLVRVFAASATTGGLQTNNSITCFPRTWRSNLSSPLFRFTSHSSCRNGCCFRVGTQLETSSLLVLHWLWYPANFSPDDCILLNFCGTCGALVW